MAYITNLNHKKKKVNEVIADHTEKYRSRSRSRKDKQSHLKETHCSELRDVYSHQVYTNSAHNTYYHFQKGSGKWKDSNQLTHAKKSSSTRSIHYKPITTCKKENPNRLESQRQVQRPKMIKTTLQPS